MGSSLLSIAKLEVIRSKLKAKSELKINKWIKWVAKRLQRKGYLADIDTCAYGNEQLVGKVKEFGEGYIFWSSACAGCPIGVRLMDQFKKKKKLPEQSHCMVLKNALISRTKVSEGDIVKLLPLGLGRRR